MSTHSYKFASDCPETFQDIIVTPIASLSAPLMATEFISSSLQAPIRVQHFTERPYEQGEIFCSAIERRGALDTWVNLMLIAQSCLIIACYLVTRRALQVRERLLDEIVRGNAPLLGKLQHWSSASTIMLRFVAFIFVLVGLLIRIEHCCSGYSSKSGSSIRQWCLDALAVGGTIVTAGLLWLNAAVFTKSSVQPRFPHGGSKFFGPN